MCVSGEWLHPLTDGPWSPGVFGKCSRCGYICNHTKKMPMFCENCGAKMDGKGPSFVTDTHAIPCTVILEAIRIAQRGENDEKDS